MVGRVQIQKAAVVSLERSTTAAYRYQVVF